jgi:hypothetical protein
MRAKEISSYSRFFLSSVHIWKGNSLLLKIEEKNWEMQITTAKTICYEAFIKAQEVK